MKLSYAVVEALDRSDIVENRLVLPVQLERSTYVAIDKVLTAAGGKWNRTAKAHVFKSDARDIIERIILAGEVISDQKAFAYFPTTPIALRLMMEAIHISPGHTMLEPSAGCGVLARDGIKHGAIVDCIEVRPDAAAELTQSGLYRSVIAADFLAVPASPVYDRVLMNPPFTNQMDIKHVRHAIEFLAPKGRLVSVMAHSVMYRDNRLTEAFRAQIESLGGRFTPMPDNAFRASGTDVTTVLLTVEKS